MNILFDDLKRKIEILINELDSLISEAPSLTDSEITRLSKNVDKLIMQYSTIKEPCDYIK